MTYTEYVARALCKHKGANPDEYIKDPKGNFQGRKVWQAYEETASVCIAAFRRVTKRYRTGTID